MQTIQPRRRQRRVSPLKRFFHAAVFIAVLIFLYQFFSLLLSGMQGGASASPQALLQSAGEGASVSSKAEGYTPLSLPESALPLGMLTLVNNSHPYSFPENAELKSLYSYKTNSYSVRSTEILLQKTAIEALNAMADAFSHETGYNTLNVVAGYRTYEEQEKLYTASLEENGEAHTVKYYADPGCSEHHTGLAVDFSLFFPETGLSGEFAGSEEAVWFEQNAWKYGFVKRYDEAKVSFTGIADEPWHFRYVGLPHAYLMQEKNLCLEEYIDYLRRYPFLGEHLFTEYNGQKFEIYFCEKEAVYVPDSLPYTISGNNIDGFILTVTLS